MQDQKGIEKQVFAQKDIIDKMENKIKDAQKEYDKKIADAYHTFQMEKKQNKEQLTLL